MTMNKTQMAFDDNVECSKIIDKLKDRRAELDMSRHKLSIKSGIPEVTIRSWEAKKTAPNILNLSRWCNALGMSLSVIVND